MDELGFYRRVAEATLAVDPQALLDGALRAAVELTGAARGAVVLADEPRTLRAHHGAGPEPPGLSDTLLDEALQGRTLRLENALDEPAYRAQPSVRGLSLLSVLAVPVALGEEVVGAVYLDSSRVSGIFTAEHQALLERLARHLAPGLARLRAARRLEERVAALEDELSGPEARLLGESPPMAVLRDLVRRVAPSEAPALIVGESGTGKELVARALHAGSPRARGPFVAVNCGALADELVESELFGHRAGAFTGARAARRGRVAAAHGGTLFLDEVGELPAAAQAALLRFLETGEVQVVGADHAEQASVRVVAATHRDLAAGAFRQDLYYRLAVVQVDVPPLRARGEDVALLARGFLARFARAEGRPGLGLGPDVLEALRAHRWPGNVRELQNAVRRAVLLARGPEVSRDDLPRAVLEAPAAPGAPEAPRTKDELDAAKAAACEALEEGLVREALRRSGDNVAQAARDTGLHRSVFHRILRRVRGEDASRPPGGMD